MCTERRHHLHVISRPDNEDLEVWSRPANRRRRNQPEGLWDHSSGHFGWRICPGNGETVASFVAIAGFLLFLLRISRLCSWIGGSSYYACKHVNRSRRCTIRVAYSGNNTCTKWTPVCRVNDFWPISITPILSCLVERLIVRDHIYSAIPSNDIIDQYGFKPTGSTNATLVDLTNRISVQLTISHWLSN